MSTNTNEFTQIEKKYEFTEDSKQKFWDKVSPFVKQKSQDAGYDPTDYILWNGNDQTWYFHEADLINWLKIVYPTSIIQTEKAMLELGSYCQYRVKIYLELKRWIGNNNSGIISAFVRLFTVLFRFVFLTLK